MPFSNSFLFLQTARKKKFKILFSVSFSRLLGLYVYWAFHVSFVEAGDWYPDTELAAFGLHLTYLKTAGFPVFPICSLYILKTKKKKARETRRWVKWKFVPWFMCYVYGVFDKSCRATWIKYFFGKLIIVHVEFHLSFVIVVFTLWFSLLGCLLVRWMTSLPQIQDGAYQWLKRLQYSLNLTQWYGKVVKSFCALVPQL